MRLPGCVLMVGPAVLSVALCAATERALGADLVAPEPPNSVRVVHQKGVSAFVLFYSKDSIDKLAEFYGSGFKSESDLSRRKTYVSFQDVMTVISANHLDNTNAGDAGVTLTANPPPPEGCNSEMFSMLRYQVGRQGHTKTEFDELCRKHGRLQAAYFQDSDQPGPNGYKTMDVVIRERFNKGARVGLAPQDTQALATKMQELVRQGKMKEAGELSNQVRADTSGNTWEDGLAYLNELEKAAYYTRVEVDKQPKDWPGWK